MRNLIRQPLTWMVIAECIVVTLLMVLVWNLVASAAQHTGVAPVQAMDVPAQSQSSPPADLPEPVRPAGRVQLPGLNFDPSFWRARLSQLNREQVGLEQLEWRIVHGAMDAARRYVETVVLPSIVRAERVGG
jgi:hypothetical protein